MTTRQPRKTRQPKNRQMLLPIPLADVRRRSIEHHMAFHMLSAGEGDALIVARLLNSVCSAYLVDVMIEARSSMEMFQLAEATLHECAARGEAEGQFQGSTQGLIAIQQVLTLHDKQLLDVPAWVLAEAQTRLARLLDRDGLSPIVPGPTLST